MFNWFKKKPDEKRPEKTEITSARIGGRWYGLMYLLGEASGRDMKELTKDTGSRLVTLLELTDEYPEETKVVNELMTIEKDLKAKEQPLTESKEQADFLIGVLEAKIIKLRGSIWKDLTLLEEISHKES